MNTTKLILSKMPAMVMLLGLLASLLFTNGANAASYTLYPSGMTGGGIQNFYAPTNPISGTMSVNVPLFNGLLGTLTQADFEFAGQTTGTWYSIPTTGISSISLAGPADVNGQAMGNIAVGFTDPIFSNVPSNSYSLGFANLTVTSGAFFNTLTGVGTIPMNWIYSGSSSLSVPATGAGPGNEGFAWGGSVHITYTYEPVPEPSTLLLGGLSVAGLLYAARRNWKIS